MKRFAKLFDELDHTTRTNEKVAIMENYFSAAPPADAAWALQFLCGRNLPRAVPSKNLWQWLADETRLPPWLIEECRGAVGDSAETMALLLRGRGAGSDLSLAQLIQQRLLPLRTLPEHSQRQLLLQTWRELGAKEQLVWNKLITGNFRVGVARTLVIRALAAVARIDPAVMAHRVMGAWQPTTRDFERLINSDSQTNSIAQPYPFFLASPVELKIKTDEGIAELGNVQDWQIEWKWDGIRAQILHRGNEVLIWSRGDEMVTDSFPEIVEAARRLPDQTVLDGELVAWKEDHPLPFAQLQRRLGRKQADAKLRAKFPVAYVAYDLLEQDGTDIRDQGLVSRRARLEKLLDRVKTTATAQRPDAASATEPNLFLPGFEEKSTTGQQPAFPIHLSPLIMASSWEEVARWRTEARTRGVEGLMLKNKLSTYGVGRQRGEWWKWKIDPFMVDAVLIAAQLGNGQRASLYTDYTFGLWDNGRLVPFAKAYSGLTNEEILQVDAFVRRNSTGKFGPVRAVKPAQVFEIAFEGAQVSSRHASGVAVRFPRMNRWRHDKKPEEADSLETLRALANASSLEPVRTLQ